MSKPCFWQFMRSHTSNFDGTRFSLLVDGRNTGPLTIARQPSGDYWDKLLSMFEIARKFDPTIELTIAFCIEYHETQIQTLWSNNKIFPTKVIDIIPIPCNVIRFFQIFPVKILLDNCTRLKSEMESATSKLEGLKQLQKESKKEQELSSLKKEQQSLLDFLKITEQKLVKTKNEFLSCFERLYPRTIKVLTRADFPECLKRIDSASEPCDDAWKVFRQSNFIWNTQMPVLFGWMMTGMVKTSLSNSRLLKPTQLLSFDELFGKLPKDMQKLYVQHRFWVINHSFLLILSSKLTNNCIGRRYSLKIQMRFLERLAKKLLFSLEFKKLHRLSICI